MSDRVFVAMRSCYEENDHGVVGVFTSLERAKTACQADLDEALDGEEDVLTWQYSERLDLHHAAVDMFDYTIEEHEVVS